MVFSRCGPLMMFPKLFLHSDGVPPLTSCPASPPLEPGKALCWLSQWEEVMPDHTDTMPFCPPCSPDGLLQHPAALPGGSPAATWRGHGQVLLRAAPANSQHQGGSVNDKTSGEPHPQMSSLLQPSGLWKYQPFGAMSESSLTIKQWKFPSQWYSTIEDSGKCDMFTRKETLRWTECWN